MRQLRDAVRLIGREMERAWPFSEDHYPALKNQPKRVIRRLSFVHMVLHLTKEAGTLARIEERSEHRRVQDLPPREWARVKRLAMKSIVSGFRLFALANGTPEELEKYIKRR